MPGQLVALGRGEILEYFIPQAFRPCLQCGELIRNIKLPLTNEVSKLLYALFKLNERPFKVKGKVTGHLQRPSQLQCPPPSLPPARLRSTATLQQWPPN